MHQRNAQGARAVNVTEPLANGPRLNLGLDLEAMRSVFRRHGRLHIASLLNADDAARLRRALEAETQWMRATLREGRNFVMSVRDLDALAPEESGQLNSWAYSEAAKGFHFLFDSVRISDMAERGEGLPAVYAELFRFLNGDTFLGFIRSLTGDGRAAYADCQATRFLPGHYLTQHNDLVPQYGRLFAYVLNLTPVWNPDWGGLLNFIDDDGHVAEAYSPAYNALNIFSVPTPHSVSFVTPFAQAPRLSLTGWIRHDRPNFTVVSEHIS